LLYTLEGLASSDSNAVKLVHSSSVQLPSPPLWLDVERGSEGNQDSFWVLTLDNKTRHFVSTEGGWREDFALDNPEIERPPEGDDGYGALSFKQYAKARPDNAKKPRKEGEQPKKKRRKRLGGKSNGGPNKQ
jgi:hypothetical protein